MTNTDMSQNVVDSTTVARVPVRSGSFKVSHHSANRLKYPTSQKSASKAMLLALLDFLVYRIVFAISDVFVLFLVAGGWISSSVAGVA
mmetsp:Transcript_52813/g.98930  ORF Transcript_52813/g.98930 Transcript_52813/m.98930 type:complete len:88 (+) Transcript_52813:1399-1662(+)